MTDTSIDDIRKAASGNIIEKLTFDLAGRLTEIKAEMKEIEKRLNELGAERDTIKRGMEALKG